MKQISPEIILLSGMSGAGKSAALNVLEDAGYFAIDNLPGPLLLPLLNLIHKGIGSSRFEKTALVMDARELTFLKNMRVHLAALRKFRVRRRIFFLDSRDGILLRRFSETRRRHPLSPSKGVMAGIQRERRLLHPLREWADQIIDTSDMNVHQLRRRILLLSKGRSMRSGLSISVISFGYRFGLPLEADLVFDVRFLPNPHYINSLRPMTGRNPRVTRFVFQQREGKAFVKHLQRMLSLLLSQYRQEGKSYLTIAFGCTGGRHRSVAVAEKISRSLKSFGYPIKIIHRDMKRGES